jgi:hypothetical protein
MSHVFLHEHNSIEEVGQSKAGSPLRRSTGPGGKIGHAISRYEEQSERDSEGFGVSETPIVVRIDGNSLLGGSVFLYLSVCLSACLSLSVSFLSFFLFFFLCSSFLRFFHPDVFLFICYSITIHNLFIIY